MIISVVTQKGGVGKTTTSVSLAAGLSREFDKKVLLIDLDPQANATSIFIQDKIPEDQTICTTILSRNPLPIHHTNHANMQIVPSNIALAGADVELTLVKDPRERRLKTQLDKIKNDYDYVIIDCPPSLSWLTINALTATDKVLIPAVPGWYSFEAIPLLHKTLTDTQEYYNPTLSILGYIYLMHEHNAKASKESYDILKDSLGDQVYDVLVPKNTAVRDAELRKMDIFAYNPTCPAAGAYRKLIKKILEDEQKERNK